MAHREYSEEVKAAVMTAMLQGQSINHVAKEYNIPRGTVATWSSQLPRNQTVSDEKRERIGGLILEYLAASLEALKAQVKVFSDETWLRGQEASELGVLHGIIADKTFRILEAIADPSDQGARVPEE